MQLGASSFGGRGLFLMLATCMVSGGAWAQQAGQPTPQPAGQPASEAAVSMTQSAAKQSATGPTPTNPTPNAPLPDAPTRVDDATKDPSKDTSDQSAMVKLGPGDLIELNVYNVPELATKARVGNSGDVYLPLIDYVHIGGLTQEEAQTVVEKRLEEGGFVRNPHVTIFVDDASSQGVAVLGEVGKPGIYPNPADHKLFEIISEAGGFTTSASRKVAIIRQNQPEPIRIELSRNLADDPSGNVDIMPGDTINVPKAPIVYVVGDVGRPCGLLVDNGKLTVLQALALAGGANRTAKMGGVRIIHKGPTGMTETQVQLKKMLEAKSPDVTLEADDILFIPVSGARVAAARTFEAAMSAATAVSIYAAHP